jgi:hypothetical protein
LAPVQNILSERVLAVTVVQITRSLTAVRTDGEAVWIVPRPAWEQIPPRARSVSFTASGAIADGKAGPVSAAQTLNGARAIRLVDFINRLGVVQPGARACPAGRYGFVRLRFYGSSGKTVARAVELPSGCAFVSLKIGTRTGPELNDYPSVTGELERLNAIPICSAWQLRPSATLPSRNSGELSVSFEFRNEYDSVCRLSGFPRLTLLDAKHHIVPTTVTDQGAAIVRREGIDAAAALDPQQSALFGVSWTRCGAPRAVSASIRLPGIAHRFALRVGSSRRPFDPCHGRVKLGNITY